jgi:hypothetical protein
MTCSGFSGSERTLLFGHRRRKCAFNGVLETLGHHVTIAGDRRAVVDHFRQSLLDEAARVLTISNR